MNNFVVECFKSDEELLYNTLILAYQQSYNNMLFLKHSTFFQFLSTKSKSAMRALLLEFQLDYAVENSIIGFMLYLKKQRNTFMFQQVLREITDKRQKLLYEFHVTGKRSDELIYFSKCIYNVASDDYMSIFKGTILHYTAIPNQDITNVFNRAGFIQYLRNIQNLRISSIENLDFITQESYQKEIADKLRNLFIVAACHYIWHNEIGHVHDFNRIKTQICMKYSQDKRGSFELQSVFC